MKIFSSDGPYFIKTICHFVLKYEPVNYGLTYAVFIVKWSFLFFFSVEENIL